MDIKNLVVTCSPVYDISDSDVFMVHLRRLDKKHERIDRLAVKFPDFSLCGVYGFSNEDVPGLIDYIRQNQDIIYAIASGA